VVVYEVPASAYKLSEDGSYVRVTFSDEALKTYFKIRSGVDVGQVQKEDLEAKANQPSWDPGLVMLGLKQPKGGFIDGTVFKNKINIQTYVCIMACKMYPKVCGDWVQVGT
jgi:hypothetical protein